MTHVWVPPCSSSNVLNGRMSAIVSVVRVADPPDRITMQPKKTRQIQVRPICDERQKTILAASSSSSRRMTPFLAYWCLLVLFLFALPVVVRAQPASTYTMTFPTPTTRTGWMAGSAPTLGVASFDDPTGGAVQSIDLQLAGDTSGALPPTLIIGGSGFSFGAWMMFGDTPGLEYAPGIYLTGALLQEVSIYLTIEGGDYIVRAYFGLLNHITGNFGSTPFWQPWQWFHLGVTYDGAFAWRFHLNGVSLGGSPSILGLGPSVNIQTNMKWLGGVESGVAELRLWMGGTVLTSTQVLSLAQTPPIVLQGMPPRIVDLPTSMSYCQSAIAVTLYAPFNLQTTFSVASCSITVTASHGATISGSPITLSDATNWMGVFTVATNFDTGTSFTLTFTSDTIATQVASTTRTVYLTSGAVLLAQAALASTLTPASLQWSAPSPSGVAGTGVIAFTSAAQSWNWITPTNTGGSGFPTTWTGKNGYTFAWWVRPNAADSNIRLFYSGTGSSAFNVAWSTIGESIQVTSYAGSSAISNSWSTGVITLGSWYHIVVSGSRSGRVSVYINGAACTFTYAGSMYTSWPLPIPANVPRTAATTDFTNGVLAGVHFWLATLTAEAVNALYAFQPINLRAPGVSSLTVTQFTDSTGTLKIYPVNAGAATLVPSWTAGASSSVYAITVPYRVYSLQFTVSLAVGTATADWGCPLAAPSSLPLTHNVASNWIWLTNGTSAPQTYMHVASSIDQTYSFLIVRASPDVGSIVVTQWQGAVSRGTLTLAPSFTAGSNTIVYNASVPLLVTAVSAVVTFGTPSTVSLYLDTNEAQASLTTGIASNQIALNSFAATTQFQVVSSKDGPYTIRIKYVADLTAIEFTVRNAGAATSNAYQMTPTFRLGIFAYSLVLPYECESFAFTVTYGVSVVTQAWAGGATTAVPSASFLSAYRTFAAPNTFYPLVIVSDYDGAYTINIKRAVDVTAFAASCDSVSGMVGTPFSFAPTFTAGTFSYSLTIDPQWYRCVLAITYTTPGTNTISYAPMSITAQAAPATTVLTATKFTLTVGTSQDITIVSTRDGTYTLTIVRDAWSVTSISVFGYGDVSATSFLSDETFNLVSFTPPANTLTAHTLAVPYRVYSVTVRVVFHAGGSIEAQLAVGAPMTLSNDTESAAFPLAIGINLLTVSSSRDGIRLLRITRAAPAVSAFSIIALFSNGEVSPVTYTPTPLFAPAITNSYSVQVSNMISAVALQMTFATGDSVAIVATSSVSAVTLPLALTSGITSSDSFSLASSLSATTFVLSSIADGDYLISITRAAQDVTDLSLLGSTLDSPISSPLLTNSLTPPFAPGLLVYSLNVPFKVAQVSARMTFAISGSVVVHTALGSSLDTITPLVSGVDSAFLPLVVAPAANQFSLVSTHDGSYNVTIIRSAPDLTALYLYEYTTTNNLVNPIPLIYEPALFQPGVVATYSIRLSSSSTKLALQATFATAGSVTLTIEDADQQLTSGVESPYVPLTELPFVNVWRVTSALDGVYFIRITRAASSLLSIPLPIGVSAPVAVLSAPASIGSCDNLLLDGCPSYGFGSESRVYEWKIESLTWPSGATFSPTVPTLTAAAMHPFNETLGATFGTFTNGPTDLSMISIPASRLEDDVTYIFSLTVGDASHPRASTVTAAVTKHPTHGDIAWLPQVNVHWPVTVLRSTRTEFIAEIEPSICQPLPEDVVFHFEWSVRILDSDSSDDALAYTSHARSMIIPSMTLSAGATYAVQLVLTSSSVSASADMVVVPGRRLLAAVSGMTTSSHTIVVGHQPLVARIVGGYRIKSVDVAFVIDGSTSFDPDFHGATTTPSSYPFTFAWSATYLPNPSTANTAGIPHVFEPTIVLNATQLRVPANSLLSIIGTNNPCTFTFTLHLHSTDGDRTAVASVIVDILPQPRVPLPFVSIHAPTYLPPQEALTLTGSIFSHQTPSYLLRCAWSCVNEPTLNLVDPSIITSKANSSNLVLRSGVLDAGFWTFQLRVTEGPLAGYGSTPASAVAQVTLYVHAPPIGGFCSISPQSGVSLDTEFTLQCREWHDPQGLEPLRYVFEYYDLSVDPLMRTPQLLQPATRIPLHLTLLPAGNLMVRVSVIDTAGATTFYHLPQSVSVSLPGLALTHPICYVQKSLRLLASTLAQQDSTTAFLIIKQLAQVLNTASSSSAAHDDTSVCETDGGGQDQAVVRQQLLDSLSVAVSHADGDSTMSADTAQLLAQSLVSLTADPIAMNNTATWESARRLLQSAIASFPGGGSDASSSLSVHLAVTVSNLLVDCRYLDLVSALTQELLSATLNGTVANSATNEFSTPNLHASATRSTVDGGADVTLANGVTVSLTPEALYAYAHTIALNAGEVDTAASEFPLALDTRIVTFDPRWSHCRSVTGTGVLLTSQITTIDITLSSGEVVDISRLLAPITFLVPINSSETYVPDGGCPELTSALTCSWWHPQNQTWTSTGCENLGFANNRTAINCSCDHLTEFAVLFHHERALAAAGSCPPLAGSDLGAAYYLFFFVMYLLVALVAGVQSLRVFAATKCQHWLMAVEHGLVMAVALFRACNMLCFYVLYRYISITTITIISGIPHLFTTYATTPTRGCVASHHRSWCGGC
jgi:hypothetical protein